MIKNYLNTKNNKIISIFVLIFLLIFFYLYPYKSLIYTCEYQYSDPDDAYADLMFDNPRSFIVKKYLFNKFKFEISTISNNILILKECSSDNDTVVSCYSRTKYEGDYKRIKFNTISESLIESHIRVSEDYKSKNFNFQCSKFQN
jgi:hypothetical protein